MADQRFNGDPAVRAWLDDYRPRALAAPLWNQIRGSVLEAVITASPTVTVAKKAAPHTAAFAAWAHTEGAPGLADALGDSDWIERYIQVGMPRAGESTRATRRAALRTLSRRIAPPAPTPLPLKYRTLKPPYRSWHTARFLELPELQPTPARRRSLAAVLLFGLGAGLDGRDLAWVRGHDVHRHSGHLKVTVCGGSRPRDVVILDRYADPVEALAAAAGERLAIGGSQLGRHNVTSTALARLVGDRSLPPLLSSRLRSTWLTTHLTLRTPLSLLLPAAGLTSARPLTDLLPYLDPIPADAATELLAGQHR